MRASPILPQQQATARGRLTRNHHNLPPANLPPPEERNDWKSLKSLKPSDLMEIHRIKQNVYASIEIQQKQQKQSNQQFLSQKN